MNKNKVISALKLMRENSKQRKFLQSIDMTINFKGMDFKKPDSAFTVELALPHPVTQKAVSGNALVFIRDKEFASELKDKARVVMENEIEKISKKDLEKLIAEFDVFLAEGPVMITVGKYLGQQLAPKGRMPKPIANMATFEAAVSRASTNIKITNKKQKTQPLIHVKIGDEKFADDALAENIIKIYEAVEEKLPGKKQNVKSVFVKTTMGGSVKIGAPAPVKATKETKPAKEAKKLQLKKPSLLWRNRNDFSH
jgi:large subunit ribosomal protein L1